MGTASSPTATPARWPPPAMAPALGVIAARRSRPESACVYTDETRPLLQGARLTAWEVQKDGIPVTVQSDNMAAVLMAAGKIQRVIVGADRIAQNGDTANKVGTYGLAVLAKAHGIPFYVAAPRSTIDPDIASGALIPPSKCAIRTKSRLFQGVRSAPEGVDAFNPAFDVTGAAAHRGHRHRGGRAAAALRGVHLPAPWKSRSDLHKSSRNAQNMGAREGSS